MRILILIPLLAAFVFLEVFIGGTRLLYTIPGMALIAFAGLLAAIPSLKTSERASLPALFSALAFATYIFVRNRTSEVEYIARVQFFILAGCLLIYLIFTLVLTRPNDRTNFFLFLGFLAIVQIVPALIQFTLGNHWMPLSWAQRTDTSWRASGFFISPNHFAGFLEVMALLGTSYVIWGRTTLFYRILCGYGVLVYVIGIAISGSRGGYLSLTAGALILLALTLIARLRMKSENFLRVSLLALGVGLILFSGILVLIFQSPHLSERFLQINDPQNPRLILWKAAIQQFQLSPIWGTGGFSYLYYGRLFRDPSVQLDPIHVHNDYLQLLADYGLVGGSLFLIFLIIHLWTGITAFRKLSVTPSSKRSEIKSDRLAWNIGALSALSAYLVHSLVDFNMQIPMNAFLMAVVLAILANAGAPWEESASNQPADFFRKIFRYSIPLLALLGLLYGIPMIRGEYLAERARIALRDHHPMEALDLAREGTRKIHDNPELYYYQGEAALQLAILDSNKSDNETSPLKHEAADSFTKGLKAFPYDSRLSLKSAQAQTALGDYPSAIDAIEFSEKIDPNSAFVSAYRGIVEYSFHHFPEAKVAFENARDLGGEATPIAQKGLDLIEKRKKESALPKDSNQKTMGDKLPSPSLDSSESGSVQERKSGAIPPATP